MDNRMKVTVAENLIVMVTPNEKHEPINEVVSLDDIKKYNEDITQRFQHLLKESEKRVRNLFECHEDEILQSTHLAVTFKKITKVQKEAQRLADEHINTNN